MSRLFRASSAPTSYKPNARSIFRGTAGDGSRWNRARCTGLNTVRIRSILMLNGRSWQGAGGTRGKNEVYIRSPSPLVPLSPCHERPFLTRELLNRTVLLLGVRLPLDSRFVSFRSDFWLIVLLGGATSSAWTPGMLNCRENIAGLISSDVRGFFICNPA